MQFILERIDFRRDVHFYTNTTIDTLDYSGTGMNTGSKVVLAAYGTPIRKLCNEVPSIFNELNGFSKPLLAMSGVIVLTANQYIDEVHTAEEIASLNSQLKAHIDAIKGIALIVISDDAAFTAANLNNYLWVTYTRCNPSHDIHGIDAFTKHKHWGCNGPLVIDARIKPHHAPPVIKDPAVEKRIDRLFEKSGSLYGVLS
jgi:4-hydroxy-3-polyprenylbenzoate decarboxylase